MVASFLFFDTQLIIASNTSTDRGRAGYLGPVKSVVTEVTRLSEQSGSWVEGARIRLKAEKFDLQGKMMERTQYTHNGSLRYKEANTVDPSGVKMIERISYYPDGTLKDIWTKSFYPDGTTKTDTAHYNSDGSIASKDVQSFDPNVPPVQTPPLPAGPPKSKVVQSQDEQGNKIIEKTLLNDDGSVKSKWIQIYAPNGKLMESADYDASGSLLKKTVFTYDDQGNFKEQARYRGDGSLNFTSTRLSDGAGNTIKTEQAHYDETGKLKTKLTRIYDVNGNLTELLNYNAANEATDQTVYDYEFDARGNWIKKTTTKTQASSSSSEMIPLEITYRTITYYEGGEDSQSRRYAQPPEPTG